MKYRILLLLAFLFLFSCSSDNSDSEFPMNYKYGGLNYINSEFYQVGSNGIIELQGEKLDIIDSAIETSVKNLGFPIQEVNLINESMISIISDFGEENVFNYEISNDVLSVFDSLGNDNGMFELSPSQDELYFCALIYLSPKTGPILDGCLSLERDIDSTLDSLVITKNIPIGDTISISFSDYFFVKK